MKTRTRRLGALAFVAAFGLTAATVDRIAQDETTHLWQQREDDAWTALTAAQTAPRSDALTSQNPAIRHQNCLAAVARYNTAASHLHDSPLNPNQECTP